MIKLENVSKYYYSSSSVTCALRKINLQFNIGEFIAITGESGSGKTTLLNIISGLDSYEDGEMYYYGKQTSYFDSKDWEKYRKEEISFIFQNYNLIDSFNVLENVMISYIIDGYSYSIAKEKAIETLKYVGLDKDLKKKASKLSGGQKQRLSIARALAKQTNIIVADEPTGNLDVENGAAILKLLKKISKDKLVIVVTHNLQQIEPYITRKIRLHDGEVVNDEIINNVEEIEYKNIDKEKSKDIKKILNFSLLNIKSQPNKSIIMFLLIFLSTISSFIFYGNFKMNIDDYNTKNLETTFFVNFDETRLLVKKNDSSLLNEDDFNNVNVKNVNYIEKYDYITDVNYYIDDDYKINYSGGYQEKPDGTSEFVDTSSYALLNHNHYMRSYNGLDESALKAGRLPTNDFEMVLYSNDLSILNKEKEVLLRNDRFMSKSRFFRYKIKVVGILKEKTKQVYFSNNLCQMMDYKQYGPSIVATYHVLINNSVRLKSLEFSDVVIDPKLDGTNYDISFPKAIVNSLSSSILETNNEINIYSLNSFESFNLNYRMDDYLEVSDKAIGISSRLFNQIYEKYLNKKQMSIFIEDYAYTDNVMNLLANKGYDSISCFRASSSDYNIKKVILRYVNLFVSILALLFINIVIILLGFTILKVKKNDYIIFKMIGLSNDLCKKINYAEIFIYAILANILLVIVSLIVKNTTSIEIIKSLFKYIRFYDYFIILFITLLSSFFIGRKFSKFLNKNLKITMLKEE